MLTQFSKKFGQAQWTALKPELPVSYAPAAVDSRGKFSWLPQRGCPECKLGKEKPFWGKKVRATCQGPHRMRSEKRMTGRIIKNNDVYVELKTGHR